MRQLVMTKGERFDIETVRAKIEAIADSFDSYLEEYPVKTLKTMHGLMGPVPMILDGARVRKEDAKTLVGKAMRMHEMNPKTKGYLSPRALEAIETATNDLLELCKSVPVTAVTKVTERIRYNVYYTRRKKAIEWLEQTRKEFINFLRGRYGNDPALANAWGETDLTFDTVRFPSRTGKAFAQAHDTKKQDVTAFWALPVAERLVEEEEENE
jgi:hypothetical protein